MQVTWHAVKSLFSQLRSLRCKHRTNPTSTLTSNWECSPSPFVRLITSLFTVKDARTNNSLFLSEMHFIIKWNDSKYYHMLFSNVTGSWSYTLQCRQKNVDTLWPIPIHALTNWRWKGASCPQPSHLCLASSQKRGGGSGVPRQALGLADTSRLCGKSAMKSGWPSHGFRDCWDRGAVRRWEGK